jgi:O-antigen/teichoic acid export membrane protein
MLLATPFFLKKLGVEQLGIWMLINSIIGSLTLLNGGFGDAAIKYISKYNAKNDTEGVNRVVNTTFSLFILISIGFTLLGYTLLIGEDHLRLFSDEVKHRELLFDSFYVVVLLFAFRLVEQVVLSFFRGFERYDIASKFSIISKSGMLLINIVLAALGYSLIQIFISSTVVTFVGLVFEIVWLKKFCPYLAIYKRPDKATLKEISSFSIWAWLQTVAGILFSQADKFVVAACAGLSVLAYYSIGFMVANQIHALFAAASSWLFPVVSKKIEQKNDLLGPYYRIQFFMILGGLFCIASLFMIKHPLFLTWLGNETYQNSILLIQGFLLFEILIIPFIVPFYFFNASGFIRINTLFMLGTNILMLVMLYLGYKFYSVEGMLAGRIIGTMFVYCFWMMSIDRLLFNQKNILNGFLIFVPSAMFVAIILVSSIPLKLALLIPLLYSLWMIYKKMEHAPLIKNQ